MHGIDGSFPFRRLVCAAACLIVLFVVVDSLRASGPQPQSTATRTASAQALSKIEHARQVVSLQQQPVAAPAPSVSPHRAVVNRYCVTCHNEKLKTGGLVLATVDIDNISATNAEALEKVVRKLQARAMPPRGMPRPDEAVYQSLVSHLETSLDRFAATNPNPGRPDTLRRLNRTEYQNAVRNLLDLEADVAAILPSDDSAHGFDNVSLREVFGCLVVFRLFQVKGYGSPMGKPPPIADRVGSVTRRLPLSSGIFSGSPCNEPDAIRSHECRIEPHTELAD